MKSKAAGGRDTTSGIMEGRVLGALLVAESLGKDSTSLVLEASPVFSHPPPHGVGHWGRKGWQEKL